MLTLTIVLAFPLILAGGYGLAWRLSAGNADWLNGPRGLGLYVLLLSVPTSVVCGTQAERLLEALAGSRASWLWIPAGALSGVGLWLIQARLMPGRTPDASQRVWCGGAGWRGFALLMLPVTLIVIAEELVWRAYLVPLVGALPASLAFALHHYHLGWRHMVFSFLAGLVWSCLLVGSEHLASAIASHLVYNVLAWRQMRLQAGRARARGERPETG